LTNEQLVAAHKANVETLFGLTSKAFESVQRLIELNVTASRSALEETARHSQALLSSHDAQELLSLQASLFQPLADKTVAYSQQLFSITAGSAGDFIQAYDLQSTELQKSMKEAISTAHQAFESIQKAVKQASDLAQTQLGQAAPAPKPATKKR
jgi:phasin family protein